MFISLITTNDKLTIKLIYVWIASKIIAKKKDHKILARKIRTSTLKGEVASVQKFSNFESVPLNKAGNMQNLYSVLYGL